MDFFRFKTITYILPIMFLSSCCEEEYKIVDRGNMTAAGYDETDWSYDIETVKGEFNLQAVFETEVIHQANFDYNLIPGAYATSCDRAPINNIVEESLILTIEPTIVYGGDSLQSGYNLLEIDRIDSTVDPYFGIVTIMFDEDFLNHARIENRSHDFQLECMTDDGLELHVHKTVTFSIPGN